MDFKKKLHSLNPENELKKEVDFHQTKREVKKITVTPISIEREVREQLSKKVSGGYLGLWLLIGEHLRLGSWDLLKGWTGGNNSDLNPRLAMQVVNESALCVNGVRPVRSLSHQGFELLNGLPFLATDKSIHTLLDEHTIAQAQAMQIALGKLRYARGDYNNKLFAFDPHRITTYSKRIMPTKKSNRKSRAKKVMQTFFSVEAISGQPVAFTLGSSATTTSKASIELLKMMKSILPFNGLVMADTEHATSNIINAFTQDQQFDVIIPMPLAEKTKKIMKGLTYQRKWAGYALGETTYKMSNVDLPIKLVVQRTGEIESEYKYKPFAVIGDTDYIKMLTDQYPERWTIEEFYNFEAAMGWDRASTFNLNIRYGKMSLALIAQAATYELRKKLPEPYKNWTAKHLADSLFIGIEGDIRVKDDTIIVTYYNCHDNINMKYHYENLPKKLQTEGIDPRVPWLYDLKVDFKFK